MMAWVLTAAPKLRPPAGIPPITPGSAVRVSKSMMSSSAATADTPSGIPIPKLTTSFARNSRAALRAMILRISKAIACRLDVSARISPENTGL